MPHAHQQRHRSDDSQPEAVIDATPTNLACGYPVDPDQVLIIPEALGSAFCSPKARQDGMRHAPSPATGRYRADCQTKEAADPWQSAFPTPSQTTELHPKRDLASKTDISQLQNRSFFQLFFKLLGNSKINRRFLTPRFADRAAMKKLAEFAFQSASKFIYLCSKYF